MMTEQDRNDCDFLVVAAVEGYARKHDMKVADVLKLFRQHDIIAAIRSQYPVLHMLDPDETEIFAEDMVKRIASHGLEIYQADEEVFR